MQTEATDALGFDPEEMVGAWSLVELELSGLGDHAPPPALTDPAGMLIYSANGYMSMTLSGRDRPSSGASDKAAAYDSCIHQVARWSFRGATLVHEVTMALDPAVVGTEQLRQVSFDGGDLIFQAEGLRARYRRANQSSG